MKFLLLIVIFFTTIQADARAVQKVHVETAEATLFCRTIGQGEPLLIIHGGPGLSQDYLLPHFYHLAKENFLIFYDQRGCGQSTGKINAETITLNTFVEDIEAIRSHFGFEKFSILGHSWGGFLALHYAIAHPEAVGKLILSNSMPHSSFGYRLFVDEWLRRMAPLRLELEKLNQTDDPQLVEERYRLMFSTYCYLPEKVGLLNLRTTERAATNGSKVYECMREHCFIQPFDLSEDLKKLHMPALIIHGEADPIPLSTAQSMHACLHGSLFVTLPECGHFPYVETPDSYFSALSHFLNSQISVTR